MKPYILVGMFDPASLEAWRAGARAEGFEAVATRDGDDVLAQAEKRGRPALVVLGAPLPRVDAFEVLRRLRKDHPAQDVAAIVTSPFRLMETAASGLRRELGIVEVPRFGSDAAGCALSIRRALAGLPPPPLPEDPAARAARERRKETARLRRIEALGVEQELPHDPMLQQIVESTARSFGVPCALVSVVLQDRTQFLAQAGLDRMLAADPGAGFHWPFCRLVAETGVELVVPDASANPVFAGNRLVRDGHVLGYAGAPVVAPGGETVATLAVASSDRLSLSAADADRLAALARRVAGELEIREVTRRAERDADLFGNALGAHDGPATLMATLATARTALESLDSGVILMDPQRRVVYANAAACALLDAPPSRLAGMTREELVGLACSLVDNLDDFVRRIRIAPTGPYVGRADFVFARPVRRAIRWIGRPVLLPSGIGQLTLLSDVTAESDAADLRRRFSCADPLTGLPNRRAGLDALAREIARASRTGEPLSLALLDVNGLRFVNRDHGSDAGDEVLVRAAEVLSRSARAGDLVARWSGEEFLLILPACAAADARRVAETAARDLESPEFELVPGITLSAGVAECRPGEPAESCISRVEEQLRQAKAEEGGARP